MTRWPTKFTEAQFLAAVPEASRHETLLAMADAGYVLLTHNGETAYSLTFNPASYPQDPLIAKLAEALK